MPEQSKPTRDSHPVTNFADFFCRHREAAGSPILDDMLADLNTAGITVTNKILRNWLTGCTLPWHSFDDAIADHYGLTPDQVMAMREESEAQPYPLSQVGRQYLIGALVLDVEAGPPLDPADRERLMALLEEPPVTFGK
jgi:hypothetical protein